MKRVLSLHHVSLLVSDTGQALDFYHGILGLPVDDSRPEMEFRGAWLQAGKQQIHLLELPDPVAGRGAAGHGGRDRHVAFTVADLDTVSSVLDDRGIGYTLSRSGRRALFCRDPDGNAIELIEV